MLLLYEHDALIFQERMSEIENTATNVESKKPEEMFEDPF